MVDPLNVEWNVALVRVFCGHSRPTGLGAHTVKDIGEE